MRGRQYPNLSRRIATDPTLLDRFKGQDAGEWRAGCGVSQYRLAAVVGVSRSTVARYELGADPVPRWYVLALVAVEPMIRREHALERDRLRNRVKARRRRKRECEARELAQVASFW